MAFIDKVRLGNGDVVRPVDWSSTPYWSTVEINDGNIETLKAFGYGIGGDVPGSPGPRKSTKLDTNLKGDGGVIQEQNELLLHTIQIECMQTVTDPALLFSSAEFQPDAPFVSGPNMKRLQRDVMVELRIANTKSYCEQPLGFFPAGAGVNPVLGAATRNTGPGVPFIIGQNGGGSVYNNRQFATPHHIGAGEAFAINLKFPWGQVRNLNLGTDPNARVRVRIYAAGYRARPVA
ncbi:MAG: hypothetical protein IPK85_01235 [Gemmatimonadetes bacterium]|nr:hypothetical protein [Gemmatimonadota bacterium]